MSAGGYIFEKKNLVYDANESGASVARWALEIHKARCEAFLEAAHRSESFDNDAWVPVQTGENDEISFSLSYSKDSGKIDYYIRDPFSLYDGIDEIQMNYPAFYSFFKNAKTNAEYLILTNHGVHNAGTSALYINPDFFCNATTQTMLTYVSIGCSMSHAYAENGFNNHNISSNDFISASTTNIVASVMPFDFNKTESSVHSTSASLIGRRVSSQTSSNLVGYTFQFGYAIKNSHIISFFRRSTNPMWAWSLIGSIVGDTMTGVSDRTACMLHPYADGTNYVTEYNAKAASYINTHMDNRLSFIGNSSSAYRKSSGNIYLYYSGVDDILPVMRTSTTTPNNGIIYSSICIGATLYNYNSEVSDIGVDGDGNGCVGYIDTDAIRIVNSNFCKISGTTFQGGNFVAMLSPSTSKSGYILGWDPSNESIM